MATVSTSGNKEIAREFTERVWNERDYDAFDELVAEDVVQHGGPMNEEMRGREAMREYVQMIHGAFPDFEATIEDQLAEEDMVVSRLTYRGTHEGEFMGFEPTGEMVETTGMVMGRIADGKNVETWTETDMVGMMQQLRVLPTPD